MDRRYETICIIKADIGEAEIKAIVTKSSELIVRESGTVNVVDEWGRRRLAYPIQKKNDGYYVLFDYNSEPAASKELERSLKINEDVVRQQTVKLDTEYVAPAPEPEKVEEPAKEETPAKKSEATEEKTEAKSEEKTEAPAEKTEAKSEEKTEAPAEKAEAKSEVKTEATEEKTEAPAEEKTETIEAEIAKETDKTEEGGADG
jgi:small subunit ribosomal protein S6